MNHFKTSHFSEIVIYVFLALALFMGLFMSGGLFYEGCVFMLAALVLGAFCNIVWGMPIKVSEAAVALVVLVLSLISQIYTKTDVQNSFHETLKLVLLIMAFFSAKGLKKAEMIHIILFGMAFTTAFFGLVAYCAKWVSGEYVLVENVLRLQSFFKYSNTTACFLACGYYSAISLIFSFRQSYLRKPIVYYWVKVASGIILLATYLTFSKAVLPMFLLVGTLFYWKDAEKLSLFIWQNLIILPFAGVILLVSCKMTGIVLFILIVTAFLLSGLAQVMENMDKLKCIWISCMIFAIFGVLLYIIFRPGILSTAFQRLSYSYDALTLIFKHPFFGFGAGSWRFLQYTVRSSAYEVGYLHNGWLELTIENGWILSLLLFGVTVLYISTGIRRKSDSFCPALILLAAHAVFDIDLSFGVMTTFWGILLSAVSNEIDRNQSTEISGGRFFLNGGIKLAAALIGVGCVYYGSAELAFTKSFEKAYISGSHEQAYEIALRYEKTFPRYAVPPYWLASLLQEQGADEKDVRYYLEQAAMLSPYDTEKYERYMLFAVTKENLDSLCEAYIKRAPRRMETYDYIRNFLYYAMSEKVLSKEECREKQEYYYRVYCKNNCITTPILYIRGDSNTEFSTFTEVDETMYVPIRKVFETLGFTVVYDIKTKSIYIFDEDNSYRLYVGKTSAEYDERTYKLKRQIKNIDGTAMISIEDLEDLTDFVLKETEDGLFISRSKQNFPDG